MISSPPQQTAISTRSSISSVTVSTAAAGGSTLRTGGYSSAAPSQGVPAAPRHRSCCCLCWSVICKCIGNDRIYGSFFGPHPTNFMCCCCKCCCKGTCIRPFVLASIATKMMWLLMLVVIMVLSCLFIIPTPKNDDLSEISHFYPCADRFKNESMNASEFALRPVRNNLTMTCDSHGGYFMVYRIFLAYIALLVFNAAVMIGVKSTTCAPQRAKMHHGFWLYKYILLFLLLLVTFTAIRVEGGGVFEYTMSWLGLGASLIFSFIQLTLLLDIVELFITQNRSSKSDWADCFLWFVTGVVVLFDLFLIGVIGTFYLVRNYTSPEDVDNLVEVGKVSVMHLLIYLYGIILSFAIFGVTVCAAARTREYPSILRSLFLIAYIQGLIWGALSVSPDIAARPHINVYRSLGSLQPGNLDTYFKADGCFQGLSALLFLCYYLFWHGPRSTKAPLSILFDRVWYWKAKKPAVPVVPRHLSDFDEDRFCTAVREYKVWDDERLSVRYSWTIFYIMMILASFTLMMSMTNFSDPWAVAWYCSSYPAVGMKLGATMLITAFYFIVTCKTRVSPGRGDDKRKSLEKPHEESTLSGVQPEISAVPPTNVITLDIPDTSPEQVQLHQPPDTEPQTQSA